jgi:hypothetical protein
MVTSGIKSKTLESTCLEEMSHNSKYYQKGWRKGTDYVKTWILLVMLFISCSFGSYRLQTQW